MSIHTSSSWCTAHVLSRYYSCGQFSSGYLQYCNEKSPCNPNSIFSIFSNAKRDVCKTVIGFIAVKPSRRLEKKLIFVTSPQCKVCGASGSSQMGQA